jgi:hypothetical protein
VFARIVQLALQLGCLPSEPDRNRMRALFGIGVRFSGGPRTGHVPWWRPSSVRTSGGSDSRRGLIGAATSAGPGRFRTASPGDAARAAEPARSSGRIPARVF